MRKYWLESALLALTAANVAAVFQAPVWETIPLHLIWLSLALVYATRTWRPVAGRVTLLIVAVTTGIAVATGIAFVEGLGTDAYTTAELTEVPLMAVLFAAMVWHVQRRQAAVEKVRQEAEREHEFVLDASHQLRTPITIARGHAELIRAGQNEQISSDVEIVLGELRSLATIADRLLLLAAARDADFLRHAPVEVERLLVETTGRWHVTAPRQWKVDASAAAGTVLGDRDRLAYALDVLIENALKFTSEKDKIAIVAREHAGDVVLEVSDTGAGIPAGQIDRVFERFCQIDRAAPDANAGTGLGLATVKAIAEAHGGTVSLDSDVGRGTSVRIQLPGFRPAPLSADRAATPHPRVRLSPASTTVGW